MKKKGLIVATIVMVLVLAVSLTTATYAWFNNSGSASVTPITITTTSSAAVLIGVEKTNTYDGTKNPSNFYSDNTVWNEEGHTNEWFGDTNGLGLAVNTGVDLSGIDGALYSFTTSSLVKDNDSESATYGQYTAATATSYTKGSGQAVNPGIDPSQTLLKGQGNGDVFEKSSLQDTVIYRDYLRVVFGAAAGKADVAGFGCLVLVHPTDTMATIGLNAAIHVAYRINGTSTWTEKDVYGDKAYNTVKNSTNTPAPALPTLSVTNSGSTGLATGTYTYEGATTAQGDAYVWIPLSEKTDGSYTTQGNIEQVEVLIYVCGPDSDCITSALGSSASVTINFLSVTSTTPKNA